jgi:DNA modification methylase/DNA-directed RNA polymerase subunit RPC12/RpoP
MNDFFTKQSKLTGPVECFGQTFSNDEARRQHFLKLLAEKLKDPVFRKTEGFPLGTDDAILTLSNPPFYTACPNPFIADFFRTNGKPYDANLPYSKEPFAADVSEGKNDPIYNAHSYHTKVPHKAIMRYILHYSQPGDMVFDGFCGTGMTGIAAQLCGNRAEVESLGYRVESDGTVLESHQEEGKTSWKPFSKLGARRAILSDLSPIATNIARNYNLVSDVAEQVIDAFRIIENLLKEFSWVYETRDKNGRSGQVKYTVWSDIYLCSECSHEINIFDVAYSISSESVLSTFACPNCGANLSKDSLAHKQESYFDPILRQIISRNKVVPAQVNFVVGKNRQTKAPDEQDLEVLRKIESIFLNDSFRTFPMMFKGGEKWAAIWRSGYHFGVTHVHHFYTPRNYLLTNKLWDAAASNPVLRWAISATLNYVNKKQSFTGGGGGMPGVLYIASLTQEKNVFEVVSRKLKSLGQTFSDDFRTPSNVMISTQSSTKISQIPSGSVDYIFLDPPFGANIMYSEGSFLWEALLEVFTNDKSEAIESKYQGKSLFEYRGLMNQCFQEAFRVLKPGRWLTVEFSSTQASVWNSIQAALQEAGFVVANVAALDKKQGGFKSVTTKTAVKQDLAISAYKPNGGLEDRFVKAGGNEDSAWDFVRTHLEYLPTVKVRNGALEFVAERDPRIIFDRLVAWFVRHSFSVPISSQEFQAGLKQRFPDRDGMVFLPDQVSGYDKKRMQVAVAPQMEMFVFDERSAIDWLSDFLKPRPSTYQEIHPEFISQLGAGWKKHESKPELASLLEDNFIQYDGVGDVPSQIHSYLSTNHKDLRGLDKDSPALIAKAKDRWYVPDPNKAQDLEKKREKALLNEFKGYQAATGRKLKEFRLEVLRAGFKFCWGNRDYATIISVAHKIPEEALQEDEKLLLWYDQALTRTEAGA